MDISCLFVNEKEEKIEEDNLPQLITIGNYSYNVTLTENDGQVPGSLFACDLWNGAILLGEFIQNHKYVVEGKNIIEFGAASFIALPSLLALSYKAKSCVITDYPNERLLETIRRNLKLNETLLKDLNPFYNQENVYVIGHLWGETCKPLIEVIQDEFDIALVGECLWLHHQHKNLLTSLFNTLSIGGKAFICFSHHVPGHEANDLSFFTKAQDIFNFKVQLLQTKLMKHKYSSHLLVEQYLYMLIKQ